MLLRFIPKSQLIDSLFSNFHLITATFWVYYFIYSVGRCIWYLVWLQKAKLRITAGEYKILNHAKETFWNWISTFMLIVLEIGLITVGGPTHLIICLATILILVIPGLLFAKYRPDKETFIGFQIVMPIILIITIICGALFSLEVSESEEPTADEFPLAYEDLQISAGEVKDTFHTSSSSIFGTKDYYSLGYTDGALTYVVYQTDQEWILDTVWDYEQSRKWYDNATDCTAIWHAEMAQRSNSGRYIVRFDDAILIFYSFNDTQLSEEQTAIIRCALGLGD